MESAKAQSRGPAAVGIDLPADRGCESSQVDRIREIIVGSRLRDYDARFSQVEERMARSHAVFEHEVRARQQDSDTAVQAQLSLVLSRIESEGERLSAFIDSVSEDLRRLAAAVDLQRALLLQRVDGVCSELQQVVGQGFATLDEHVTAQQHDLKATLTARLDGLQQAGVQRERLAATLEALARDLRRPPQR